MPHIVSDPTPTPSDPTQQAFTDPAGLYQAPHIWPIPDVFWRRESVRALDPHVCYVGPMTHTDSGARTVAPTSNRYAFVYLLSTGRDCLYVGKTVNICGRFSKHRHQKKWWPEVQRLTVLALHGADRQESEIAAFYIERLAIRDCHPIHNIAGVV